MLKTKQDIINRLNVKSYETLMEFPKYFEFETINACQARCVMCPVAQWDGSAKKVISQNLWEKFRDEVALYANSIEKITLTRDGEPLLDKNITNRIKELKERKIKKVVITTNAALLSEQTAQKLLNAELDEIMISIDGTNSSVYEKIRVGLKFEKVIQNAKNFISLRNATNSHCAIKVRFIEQPLNIHQSQDFLNFWKGLLNSSKGDICYVMPLHFWGGQIDTNALKGANSNKKQAQDSIKNQDSIESGYDLDSIDQIESNADKVAQMASFACVSVFSSMAIHYDGSVGICGVDFANKHKMGDLNKNSIKEIWQGEFFQKARKLHLSAQRNNYELCKGCDLWDRNYKY